MRMSAIVFLALLVIAARAGAADNDPASSRTTDIDALPPPGPAHDPADDWPEKTRAILRALMTEAFAEGAVFVPSRTLADGTRLQVRPLRRFKNSSGAPCGIFILSHADHGRVDRKEAALCLIDGIIRRYVGT